eukprot:GFUD01001727.1.p1 GENE.GFUD01001727.1~~GFUD01001727.1.p1  ORF type:complete len:545 (+),score=93.94 GFUD01001727.1:155-1789(+)
MRRGRIPELGLFLLGYQMIQKIGVTNIPPVTLSAIIIQVAIYLQFLVVPRLCLSGASIWSDGEYLRLVVPAIRHTHDLHLYYNMVSLAWKGLVLERRVGSVKFLLTLIVLTVMSSTAYVGLALLGSDLLGDPSLMRQCAIGFSGVLFAMKVVNNQYQQDGNARTSYFGFLIPMKYAVWVELVVIQIVVPNSSFMGHLGGIVAGLIYVKGPINGLLSLLPMSSSSSILPSTPATLLLTVCQSCLHFGLVPHLPPLSGCLPTRQHMTAHLTRVSTSQIQSMFAAPFHHLSVFHLVINLFSFWMKSRKLETKLGVLRYSAAVILSVLGTSIAYISLGRLWMEWSGSTDHLPHCVVGLSGPLFALKVITIKNSDSLDLTLLFELAELAILVEKNSRFYHFSGLVTGVFILCFSKRFSGHSWSSAGQRLGRLGTGENHQPNWTRSWGYAGQNGDTYTESSQNVQDYEMEEALERSRQTHESEQYGRSYTPSAPPEEEVGRFPDMVRARPPIYPYGIAPPPPGPGYRIDSSHSRSLTDDELRRRRLERFS